MARTHYKTTIGLKNKFYCIEKGETHDKDNITSPSRSAMIKLQIKKVKKSAFLFRITAETAGVDNIPSLQ